MRRWTALLGNSQRLDGGAMFGNAPRALWSRWATPDDQNRIPLACRCLLVDDGGRRVLFETGIGAFFDPAMASRFGVEGDGHVLLRSLAAVGLTDADIDVVVLSHLHFDHAGGLLSAHGDGPPRLLFPRASYVISDEAWARAVQPHVRDRASFIPVLQQLLEQSGRLEIVAGARSAVLGDGYRFHRSHGHTPGLLLTEVDLPAGPMVFAGDLIPGAAWVHAPITMGYDRYPELLIDEKEALLGDLAARGGAVFFTHDPALAAVSVLRDDKGRFSAGAPVAETWA
jgi:glyoxylase-like metal-dependent hydrolase (beta-lactamase superfamily II)